MSRQVEKRHPQVLEIHYDADPVLRKQCRQLSRDEIRSSNIQNLIDDMKYTSDKKKTGVGLSANQVGETVAISVITIKPTPARPNLELFDKICINTEITETFGEKEPKWEGCQSTTRDENSEPSMAQVPRFTKIRIKYLDRDGTEHDELIEGFVAHVLQHETDHLNGVLFTDLVDTNTLISYREYCSRTMRGKKK